MKRHWTTDELIQKFTLRSDELAFWTSATDHNRRGFSVLFKFFEHEGRFPQTHTQVPDDIIRYLAEQLSVQPEVFHQYNFKGRSIRQHRARIRQWFNFRPYVEDDRQPLINWFIEALLPENQKMEFLIDAILKHLQTKHIEPPSAASIERIISSAIHTYETQLFLESCDKLPIDTRVALDSLLKPIASSTADDAIVNIPLYQIRTCQVKSSLNSVLQAATQLQRLQQLKLPADLFSSISPKVVQRFKQRAAVEAKSQLYGLGTNMGIKRVSNMTKDTELGEQYGDLYYVYQRYLHKEALRQAIAALVNETFHIRPSHLWGEGTTACASDARKFAAWDGNLLTAWHIRYHGRGVMVYWHVERQNACIYSQFKSCSSSEVAAMIEGVLRHCTDMEVEKNYVDTRGQSEVGFAFCHLLGFQLLPRLSGIGRQRLYRPEKGNPYAYPNLQLILTRPINWELIPKYYDEMIKYATALRLGTAEADALLQRFTRNQPQHPIYSALAELGKVVKTIFLCHYLASEELRREIYEGLNVIENWNSTNDFILYGKGSEISSWYIRIELGATVTFSGGVKP